jgi:phage/plasmid-like protein (TIGR03299 family)
MSHEITIRQDGKAEFAFSGPQSEIWHSLGQQLTPGASIEDWVVESGLSWEIFESKVMYQTVTGPEVWNDKRVLFRSDTNEPLSVVGQDYKIVQPVEVLEFFRDLTTLHGMELSAAGSLFNGKRFWATAKTGKSFEAVTGDDVDGYLLLVTSADGSMSTSARLTSTRAVCNNTLTVALSGASKKMVKKSHRAVWDADQVKLDMGLVDESWEKFSESIKRLAETEITDKFATQYIQKKIYIPEVLMEDQPTQRINEVNTILELYNSGVGANFSRGTAWGIINAFTAKHTHGNGKRQVDKQMFHSHFGNGDKIKTEVYDDMVALFL